MNVFNKLLKPISQEEIDGRMTTEFTSDYLDDEFVMDESVDIESTMSQYIKPAGDITVASYFKSRDIDVDMSHANNTFAPVEALSLMLAINYDKCKDFYKYIRSMIAKKRFDLCYNTYPLTNEERAATNMIAEKLGKYGVISNLRIPDNSKEITGTLSTAPRIINFINGDYLEFYSRVIVHQVVEKIAKEQKCTYEVYSNVIISKESEKHELDIVFRVGNEVFWAEIKSGKFTDFDCYRKLGLLMGVNPDKHILLAAEKTVEEAETISWFYQFYVSNIQMFKDKLIEMIKHACEEEHQNG